MFPKASERLTRVWRLPIEVYAAFLAVLALALAASLVSAGYPTGQSVVVAALSLVAVLAERATVRFSSAIEESVSLLPMLFAAVLFGPVASLLVFAASMLADFRRPYLRWAFYTSSRAVTGACTGLVAFHAQQIEATPLGSILIATALGACVAQALDAAFAAIIFTLRGHGSVTELLRTVAPINLASIPLYATVVALLAVAYHEVSPWTLPLFFVPALAAQRLFVLYEGQRLLASELATANQQLERANLSFAAALVATLDARDQYSAGHSAAVAIYARDIARRLALNEDQRQLAFICGLVHDIGKVGLPAGLLEKQGPLTLDERRLMEAHSVIGERILCKVDDYSTIAKIVRHHHERIDGHGYPDGLRADEIPLISRIIAVADAYNAMTSDRPYRDAMPSRVARLRLAQAVETQFDTTVVAAFEAILAGATEAYRLGERPDFRLDAEPTIFVHRVSKEEAA